MFNNTLVRGSQKTVSGLARLPQPETIGRIRLTTIRCVYFEIAPGELLECYMIVLQELRAFRLIVKN